MSENRHRTILRNDRRKGQLLDVYLRSCRSIIRVKTVSGQVTDKIRSVG